MARDTEGVLGKKQEKERDVKAEKVAKIEQPGMSVGCYFLLSVISWSWCRTALPSLNKHTGSTCICHERIQDFS